MSAVTEKESDAAPSASSGSQAGTGTEISERTPRMLKLPVGTRDTLKKIFSHPVNGTKGKRKRTTASKTASGIGDVVPSRRPGGDADTSSQEDEEDPIDAFYKSRRPSGVCEPNVWARKVCRERLKTSEEYEECFKIYEKLEPKMYQIGRCYEMMLNSLRTPLVLKLDRDEHEERSVRSDESSVVSTTATEPAAIPKIDNIDTTMSEFAFSVL